MIPNTIEVAGRTRPTKNSEGRLIHPTLEGIVNFWKWAGDTALVDETTGCPIVVYHGTKSDFGSFDTKGRGKSSGAGAFFTEDKDVAGTYTGSSGSVMPCYINLGNKVARVPFSGRSWNRGPMQYEVYDEDGDFVDSVDSAQEAQSIVKRDGGSYIEYPLVLNADGDLEPEFSGDHEPETTDSYAASAKRLGFTSFIAEDVLDAASTISNHTPHSVYVVFSPNQVKSASGNNGEFSRKHTDITAAVATGTASNEAGISSVTVGLDKLLTMRQTATASVISVLRSFSVPHIRVEAKYSRENDFLRHALAERDLKSDTYIIHNYGPAELYFEYLRDNNEDEYQKLVDATGNDDPDEGDLFAAIISGGYEPSPGAVEAFLHDTRESALEAALKEDDMGDSTLNFSLNNRGKLIPRNTWVGHFCSDAHAIASKGFIYGESDPHSLGLTTHKSDAARKRTAGYNFGFELNEMHKNWHTRYDTKYGDELVLFQTSGVSAKHYSDKEDQVIFWGPQVDWVVPIVPASVEDYEYHSDDDYAVLATDGSYAFRTSSNVQGSATYGFSKEKNCIACAEWVVKNINAYRKSIVWHTPKGKK